MSADQEKLIAELVEKGLAGDMDEINAIEDRVLRGKVKSALAKAKRAAKTATTAAPTEEKPVAETIADTAPSDNHNQKFGQIIEDTFQGSLDAELNDTHIQLKPDNWFEIAKWLKSEPSLHFDSLQCHTGMDMGENMLEARYNLHSMTHDHKIEIRIAVSREKANIPSIEQIWRIGDWFERETYDMFGIFFDGHRDHRRMLLPEDWEGYPLRKDYEVQETYHGIAIPKVKEGWE
ncbi:MAG: NADH-quinone oxidoreductase subunit C [Candidatus Marinimicrobia bacterium]|nr:NADH-quinone oxidoreductase subunit C [Candidatus Neomarinimicrobiota bacterium]